MERRAFKIKSSCGIQAPKPIFILRFFKKIFLILALGLSLPSAFAENSGGGEAEESSMTVQEIIETCGKRIKSAELAIRGIDVQSSALMIQATSQATAVGGQSARAAHQGTAAVSTVLAGSALKRCTKCKEAINKCKNRCNPETECQIFQSEGGALCSPSSESPPEPGECLDARKNCQTQLAEKLEKCVAFSPPCGQVCTQAGLSGLTALTSLMAARKLGNCQGSNCKKTTSTQAEKLEPNKEDPGFGPQSPRFGKISAISAAPFDDSIGKNPSQISSADLAGSKTNKDKKTRIADKDGEGHYFGREGLSDGVGGVLGSSGSSMAGGIPSSSRQASLGSFDKKDSLGKKLKDRSEDGEEMEFSPDGFKSGGGASGYQTSKGGSNRVYNRGKGGKSDKKSERELSAETGSQADGLGSNSNDSIFAIASRQIRHFCNDSRC